MRQFPLDGRCNPRFETCLASPSTRAALDQDLAAANEFDSDGTPIVAVNGRRGTSFEHPAFDPLPPGNASAHLH